MGKLQEQMKTDLLLKGYSPNTIRQYLHCIRNFAKYFMRPPAEMGETEIRQFMLYLTQERKVSAFVQSSHVNALKFLYRTTLRHPQVVEHLPHPKRPKTLPKILTMQEVLRFFAAIQSTKYKALLGIIYGAGLRISEACALKPADIDSQRMLIHVRRGKGNKDRYVLLGETMLTLLREYYQTARRKGDYLFPGQKPQNPLTTTSIRHVLKKVTTKAGLSKKITPHTLRHNAESRIMPSSLLRWENPGLCGLSYSA